MAIGTERGRVVFISEPHDGVIFITERSRRGGNKLLWSCVPVAPVAGDIRIDASEVPNWIRRRAYKLFEGDRNRKQTLPELVAAPVDNSEGQPCQSLIMARSFR